MKIRSKVFLIVVVVFGLLIFVSSRFFTKIETENFKTLEQRAVNEDLSRIQSTLQGRFDDLEIKLSDWSRWDDTYTFAENGNQEYVTSNLPDETLTQLHLNFIVIENAEGQTVFKRYINNGESLPFPADIEKILSQPNLAVARSGQTLAKIKGVIDTSEGPFVLAVQSITTSDGSKPPRGLIAFGYAIDDDFVESLSHATVLTIDKSLFVDATKSNAFKDASLNLDSTRQTYIQQTNDKNTISGYVLAMDLFGNPSTIFRAQISRDINKLGVQNIQRLNIFLFGMGVAGVVVVLILFEIFVIRKIHRLAEGVQSVSHKGDTTERLPQSKGSDEFALLNREINNMLDVISLSNAEKQESELRFLNIADSAPVMIWVSDSANKIIYVNNALMDFLGKPEDALFGDRWMDLVHPEDREKVASQFQESAEKRQKFSQKYRVLDKSGGYKWIQVEAVVRVTAQGIFKGFIGTAIDMTGREEQQTKPEEQKIDAEKQEAIEVKAV